MSRIIEPMGNVVLVKLAASEYGDIAVPEKEYDSVTSGEVVAVNREQADNNYLIGRTAYWRKYKDDARIPTAEGIYALIEINDILGTSYEE